MKACCAISKVARRLYSDGANSLLAQSEYSLKQVLQDHCVREVLQHLLKL